MENDFEPVRLLTVQQAAEALNVSARTLQRMLRRKHLLAVKIGSQWRIRECDLAKFVHDLEEL
jgi:excisionase family DNA binding protein